IKKGDIIEFTVQSLPGETFSGKLSYIDPIINPQTRVAQARLEIQNSHLKFKPEMFVSGKVESKGASKENSIVVPKTAVMWTG
ncbi:efflux RND transporter periplasmic adaptor subunit, partial [Campylobacter fetus subsp. venerealis]